MADLEGEQLGAADARRGEQLEHQPMVRVHDGHDLFHRGAGERAWAIFVLLDPRPVGESCVAARVVCDQPVAPCCRKTGRQRPECVAYRPVRERAAARLAA